MKINDQSELFVLLSPAQVVSSILTSDFFVASQE